MDSFDPNCEFCVLARDGDAAVVYESAEVLAFLPLKPATTGHTLVIPKKHIRDLFSLAPSDTAPVMAAVVDIANAIKTALSPDGMNLISSAGEAASQTVFHLHMHLVPRWGNDGFGSIWPPSEPWGQEMEESVAELIRNALKHRN